MSFTVKIKEEISNIKSTKSEIIAELSGYIRNNGIFQDNKVTLNTENKFLVDRISNFIQVITDINPQVEIIENLNFSKKELYQITIENNLDKMLKEFGEKKAGWFASFFSDKNDSNADDVEFRNNMNTIAAG